MNSKRTTHRSSPDWTIQFFGRLYGEIYSRHLLSPEQSRREADFVEQALGLGNKHVLDIAAGFGRHAVHLARRNKVVALDLNAAYLAMARKGRTRTVLRNMDALRGDMRHLPLAGASFDAALLLFNSFGFCDVMDRTRTDPNLCVLTEAARVLRPGGAILIELPNPAPLLAAVADAPRRHMAVGPYEIEEMFHYDAHSRVLSNRTKFRKGAVSETAEYHLRLYRSREAMSFLHTAGLGVVKIYGSYAGDAFLPEESPMMLIHARLLERK